MPRICEQSGLLAVVPTPRDAGGTVSACVATRVRFRLAVSPGVVAALGVLGRTVCCDVALEGVGWDGVAEGVALGVGVAGDWDVVG
jgi:hypothetical protein